MTTTGLFKIVAVAIAGPTEEDRCCSMIVVVAVPAGTIAGEVRITDPSRLLVRTPSSLEPRSAESVMCRDKALSTVPRAKALVGGLDPVLVAVAINTLW